MKRICVFCGSSLGASPAYADAARRCGNLLATRGIGLVYGGGKVGLMGILAEAALAAGGEVIGVIPKKLMQREVGHSGLSSLITVGSMHERKAKMAQLSDGFIALPGGVGTMEEFFEVFTWLQLGYHRKPVGLVNAAGFYYALLEFLSGMERGRFLKSEQRAMLLVEEDIEPLLGRMAAFVPCAVEKWLDGPTTSKSSGIGRVRETGRNPGSGRNAAA